MGLPRLSTADYAACALAGVWLCQLQMVSATVSHLEFWGLFREYIVYILGPERHGG